MIERNTFQKNAILDFLKTSKDHPTAEDVYNAVVKIIPSISKATVYRNLNSMAENGIINKVEISGARDKYDYFDKHYHAKCVVCGKIFDLNIPYDESLDKKISSKYHVLGHEIIFKVICSNCDKKK